MDLEEAMNNNAVPTTTEAELHLAYGSCIYCGQMHQIETLTEELTDEYLNKMATDMCKCEDAANARVKEQKRLRVIERIEKMSESYSDVTEILKNAVDCINDYRVRNIVVDTGYDVKFTLDTTTKGNLRLKKVYKKTISEEM